MEQPATLISVVRQKVRAALHAMGAGDGECAETILIKDGHFVGRRFCLGGFEAVWIVGENQFSIFGERGEVIVTQSLEGDVEHLRKAA